MATRSFIIIANPKGDYTGIYCHFDGYPSYVGRLLSEHYRTKGKARELIRLGSLSSLGERAAPINPAAHTFDNKEDGTTVAYHRDRGEACATTRPITKPTLGEMLQIADANGCEYVYLYWGATPGTRHWSFAEIDAALERRPFTQLTPETIKAYQEA